MSYSVIESSVEDGAPIYFYEFNTQLGYYRFNSGLTQETILTYAWDALNIKHSKVSQAEQLSKNNLTIDMPVDCDMQADFLTESPQGTFTLYRAHSGDSEAVVYWKGLIKSQQKSDGKYSIYCESLFVSIKQTVGNERYTKTCRHTVYGRGCNLDPDDFEEALVLSDVSGRVLTVTGADAFSDGYFNAGFIQFPSGAKRYISSHVGELITISRLMGGLNGDESVSLYPGCDKTISTCINKFNNLDNQGACPGIPDRNPMGGGSIL